MVSDRIRSWVWALRLKLAYHLVGGMSFVANVDVIGHFVTRRITMGGPIVRDVYIYEDYGSWLKSRKK